MTQLQQAQEKQNYSNEYNGIDSSPAPASSLPANDSTNLPRNRDKTWGEKVFDRSVYGGIGYGVNLGLSALVSYFILENKHGAAFKNFLQEKFYKQTLGVKHESMAKTLTNAFTLMMGGHIVATAMIKPAEDHKGKIVRWLDKQHYGEDAELDPTIKQAHEHIDREHKPTLLGIIAARMTSWGFVQMAAYSVGNEKNLINKLGDKIGISPIKKFKGIELHSKEAGTALADHYTPSAVRNGASELLKPLVNPEGPVKNGLTSSDKSPLLSERQKTVYKEVLEYTFMDVFYTAITAFTIKPINTFLMKHVPLFRHGGAKPQEIPTPMKTAYFLDQTPVSEEKNEPVVSRSYQVNNIAHDGLLAAPQLQKA